MATAALFGAMLLPPYTPTAVATSNSDWITGDPALGDQTETSIDKMPATIGGNRDCQDRKVITRPGKIYQTEQSRETCVVDTGFGAYALGGLLQRPGTNIYGTIWSKWGSNTGFVTIPYSDDALLGTGTSGYGTYMSFVTNISGYLTTATLADDSVQHYLNNNITLQPIIDRSGQRLPLNYNSISFSADGRWLIADVPYIGFVRTDMKNHDVLPFSDPINYNIGVDPAYQAAISPDGRYAVIASREFRIFKLFDLESCSQVPDHITSKTACTSRDLFPLMQQKIPGFFTVSNLRFHGDYSLDMYTAYKTNNVTHIVHTSLTAEGHNLPGFDYLALGDSFASGEGAFHYKGDTDTNDNKCHLSLVSYPYLLAAQLHYSQYNSIACSGAKMNDVESDESDYKGQVFDGIKREDRNLPAVLNAQIPGFIGQVDFVGQYRPSAITVSGVGNDIGFADIIKRCVSTDTCYGYYEERLAKIREIDSKFYDLSTMYTELKRSGPPGMRVYVIGYPQITSEVGDCEANVHLNTEELKFANDLVDYLDNMIERAAARAGAFYVDTQHAFDDHRLCDPSASIAVNGLTAGRDGHVIFTHIRTAPPLGNESYHPNEYGHSLFSSTILTKTNNLTAPMPEAQPDLEQPKPIIGVAVLDNAPKDGIYRGQSHTYPEMGNDTTVKDSDWIGQVGPSELLKPHSSAIVEIHSTPTQLGNFTVKDDGSLNFDVHIPSSLEPGFHTMHVYVTNIANEPIDFEKVIYVGASNEDADGDGVLDELDSCPTIEQSGQDIDQDRTDDACDPAITEPPLPPTTEPDPDETSVIEPTTDPQNSVDPPANSPASEEAETPNTPQNPTDPSKITAGNISPLLSDVAPADNTTIVTARTNDQSESITNVSQAATPRISPATTNTSNSAVSVLGTSTHPTFDTRPVLRNKKHANYIGFIGVFSILFTVSVFGLVKRRV